MVTREFGNSNAVATKLGNAARAAKIADTRFPNMSPESILNQWSIIITEDYTKRNPEIGCSSNTKHGTDVDCDQSADGDVDSDECNLD
jgi:hypothetical protein